MSDLREHFATAGAPRNTWSDRRQDEQSLLGALGMADPLGAALWRLKYKGDARLARRCVVLLADKLEADGRWVRSSRSRGPGARGTEKRVGRDATLLQRLAFRVISEWVSDQCTECHGRGTVGALGHVRTCPGCKGTRREPAQHLVRARDLGVTMEVYRAHWEWRIGKLLVELESLDEAVRSTLRAELKPVEGSPLIVQPEAMTIAPNEAPKKSAA